MIFNILLVSYKCSYKITKSKFVVNANGDKSLVLTCYIYQAKQIPRHTSRYKSNKEYKTF